MTLADVLTRRNVRFRTSDNGNKIHIDCPFCARRGKPADTKKRLCIHARLGWARCLHCDWKRPGGRGVAEVLRRLGIEATVDGGLAAEPEASAESVELPEDFQPLSKPPGDELDIIARDYLLKRGITPEQIRRNRIGVSYSGRYAYRVIFPIYADGKLVGINSRDFTGSRTPKYLTSRGEKYIWGFDPKALTVFLSEGVVKALRIEQIVSRCSAALLGHDLAPRQLEQIRNSACKHVILYPDTDKVGREGFCKVADKILESTGLRVSVVWPVPAPADDVPLDDLRILLDRGVLPYSWHLRLKITL